MAAIAGSSRGLGPSSSNCPFPTSSPQFVAKRELGFSKSSRQLMTDRLLHAQNLYRKDLRAHYGCVNAVEFSNDGEWLVSGGDDRRVLLWNVEKAIQSTAKPFCMSGKHSSNIFCLGFDNFNTKVFSSGNDEQVIVHDAQTGATLDVFLHEEAVYGLSIDPLNDNVFASACDDGRVLVWDIRERNGTEPFCLASFSSAFHAVMYNPVDPRLLATANSKMGVSLWDIRQPKKWLIKYGSSDHPVPSCMSVRFNSSGTQILALRRRFPPILFDLHSSTYRCQFDHRGYYNSCTMKSCCFAGGSDQYVLSGSDDFNLYLWKVPEEGSDANLVSEATMILRGHRSIVNQVRFNSSNFLLASSGVEKIVKLWSPFQMPESSGGLTRESPTVDKVRKVYTHDEYVNLVMRNGQVMTHDYSNESMQEDPRMMAFFDSLVQREIEGLTSDSSLSAGSSTWLFNMAAESVTLSEIDSSSAASTSSPSSTSSSSSSSSDDDDNNDETETAAAETTPPPLPPALAIKLSCRGRAVKRALLPSKSNSSKTLVTSTPIASSSRLVDSDSNSSLEDNISAEVIADVASDSSSSSSSVRETETKTKRRRIQQPTRTARRIATNGVPEQQQQPPQRKTCRFLRSSNTTEDAANNNCGSVASTSGASSTKDSALLLSSDSSTTSDEETSNAAVTTSSRRQKRRCKRRNVPTTNDASSVESENEATSPPSPLELRKRTATGRARKSTTKTRRSLAANANSVECVAVEQTRMEESDDTNESDDSDAAPDSGIASQFFDVGESSVEQQQPPTLPTVVRFKHLRMRLSPVNATNGEVNGDSAAKQRRVYRRGAVNDTVK